MYLSDKHRTELAYLGNLLLALVVGGITSENPLQLAEVANNATKESTEGLTQKHREKIERRAVNLCMLTIAKESDKAHGEKVLFAVYLFIENLVTSGYLQMPEDSNIAKLVDFLLSLVDADNRVTQRRLKKAKKTANKWLEKLNEMGYFDAVAIR